MKKKVIHVGTLRINSKNLKIYEKTRDSWKQSSKKFPSAIQVINLFKAHKRLNELIDKKNQNFLKGQYYKGKCQGARINILPNGEKLDKAYSLFADDLTIHDQTTNSHWDIIYKNPNGKYAYVYTLKKHSKSVDEKYKSVDDFERHYNKLNRNVLIALKNPDDRTALAMLTLLKTYMRVGNEIYYKAHKHKGLTTIQKRDISVKGNQVNFKYKGKDGVPLNITESFPGKYISNLRRILSLSKNSDFIFTNSNYHPLRDSEFKEAFKKYCGEEFYPHIVRSYYATKEVNNFIKRHNKATKYEVNRLFLQIASRLGHKRFSKKDNEWKDSFTTTIHHYIKPQLVEQIQALSK
jgi:DNA topoisomerase-1